MRHTEPSVSEQEFVPDVDPDQLNQWLQSEEAVLFDVREPDEFARERIARAHSVPLSRFTIESVGAHVRPGQRAVFHCRSGRRSADACRRTAAIADPRLRVSNLAGGIEAWKAAGLPVVVDRTRSRISLMRQVQIVVGAMVLLGSLLAWFVDSRFIVLPALLGSGLLFAGLSGWCGLASLLALMPWNRATGSSDSCSTGSCG